VEFDASTRPFASLDVPSSKLRTHVKIHKHCLLSLFFGKTERADNVYVF